jgi:broad specificity phosphatase PhoE
VALQGDLQSFALPDVLRLLAGTSKTGRLGVTGAERTGDVWLRDGQIVAGAVSSSPHATDPADVVFELLRFESGSFAFEDGLEPAEAGEPTSVDDAISRAEELVREWDEVEAVVPSVHSWVSFVAEIEGDSTTISAEHWRTLAVIGGGMTVRDLGDHFQQTDLAASRRVKALVEAGLVQLGDAPEDRPERVAAAPEPTAVEHDDLSVLRADDGPVVLETSEDALLPEPLPGEGTSFEGDLDDMASVDGRRFDDHPEATDLAGSDEPTAFGSEATDFRETAAEEAAPEPGDFAPYGEPAAPAASEDPFASFSTEPAAEASDPPPADLTETDPFSNDPFSNNDFFGAPSGNASEEVGDDPLDSTPSSDAAAGAAAEGDDSDRGALLDFLSTVKP